MITTAEAAQLIRLAASYDNRQDPRNSEQAQVMIGEWCRQLHKYSYDQVAEVIRLHYSRGDTKLSIAGIRHSISSKVERPLYETKPDLHKQPPADLVDRSRPCQECGAPADSPCFPRRPFRINCIGRNPESQAKFEEHSKFDAQNSRPGLICACCGETTAVPD